MLCMCPQKRRTLSCEGKENAAGVMPVACFEFPYQAGGGKKEIRERWRNQITEHAMTSVSALTKKESK